MNETINPKELKNVHDFSLFYQGYRQGIMAWYNLIKESEKWKDKKVYRESIYKFLTENLANCEAYRLNGEDCCFKDHKLDKNGKLVECTAYI